MNVFEFRDALIKDYSDYIKSFIKIGDPAISAHVEKELEAGLLWPEPLIQLNPFFKSGAPIDQLVEEGLLHPACSSIFRMKKEDGVGKQIPLHQHQSEAIRAAHGGHNYILTTGTGSGKSLAYIIPIVDHILRTGSGRGVQAIIVYPMNALANSQYGELEKFLRAESPGGRKPARFEKYTGQESEEEKQRIITDPPDILLTNYVMLELLLTRPHEAKLIRAARGLKFLVLDELHTYRGRQGADVSLLVRRVRDRLDAPDLQHVGTSATLAGGGSYDAQRKEVAGAASRIFGATVRPEHVIGETLKRITSPPDFSDPDIRKELARRIAAGDVEPSTRYGEFIADPLSAWVESSFGVTREKGGDRLIRRVPMPIAGERGAAAKLSRDVGADREDCAHAIMRNLLGGRRCEPDPETGARVFAFRLHQFISKGDAVYASLEPRARGHITVQGQTYTPGDRNRLLFPMAFCRECGQEYYCVTKTRDPDAGVEYFTPRDFMEKEAGDEETLGFLYANETNPWPGEADKILKRAPGDWIEEFKGGRRIRKSRRKNLPQSFHVKPDGRIDPAGAPCEFIRSPFQFCLHCGVSYSYRGSDYARLSSLGAGGRSSATTILALAAVRRLEKEAGLEKEAKKLLSFTDNRQDASLQAGHFNDFLEVGLLRAGLYKAAKNAGERGLRYDEVVQEVFDALRLPKALYAKDPDVRYHLEQETDRALRNVLDYRIYRDLKRGWRINLPNLEQCGLLVIEYASLSELCENHADWADCHPALAEAPPGVREKISRTLLDFMRRELAIKVGCLSPEKQERIQRQSWQRLVSPWAIDEDETMEHAAVLYARPKRKKGDYGGDLFLSPRGKFGRYLARPGAFEGRGGPRNVAEREILITQLLQTLQKAGLVEVVRAAKKEEDAPGWQLPASAILWKAGSGKAGFHDPLTSPDAPAAGVGTNRFFIAYYTGVAADAAGVRGREHTAQVPYETREQREKDFGSGDLPVLFCSPTMELGVDIKDLCAVNLRNIPPTPANYAQRSGRAGRGGEPALVYSYCAAGNSHDQYFFKRPGRMVAGAVLPPRLDLANEDLVRAHVHAIWLAETGQSLGKSLKSILDLSGDEPSLEILDEVADSIGNVHARQRARARAINVLESLKEELGRADWWSDHWLDGVIRQVERAFDAACDRWRGQYRAAHSQARVQGQIIRDASRSRRDTRRADNLRRDAEAQLHLLRDEASNALHSDYYSYRYFASEGFLPGYNFPRLPLTAFIPGRRGKTGREEFL
ncbi:MAG: DEAD/DEAH box helicase, partial [Desulfobacterales bacterium]|nr:DEAD/DEAH box helicase [Desulfobacterales bacterium]